MDGDVGDNRWPQGKSTSAVTANIIPHHLGYGRVTRRRRAMPKFVASPQNPTRIASNPWKIGRVLRQIDKDLKKATPYANLSLRRNPSGGCQIDLHRFISSRNPNSTQSAHTAADLMPYPPTIGASKNIALDLDQPSSHAKRFYWVR